MFIWRVLQGDIIIVIDGRGGVGTDNQNDMIAIISKRLQLVCM